MKQKYQGKEKDLGHVRYIFFGDTADPDFLKVWPSVQRTDQRKLYNAITSVRFDIPSDSSGMPRPYRGFIVGTLMCLTGVEKLVLAGPGVNVMDKFSITSVSPNVSKAVIMIDPWSVTAPFISQSKPSHGKSQTLSTIVYAFRSFKFPHVSLTSVQLHLARAATRNDAGIKILVVNAETARGGTEFQQRVEVEIAKIKGKDSTHTAPSTPDDTAKSPQYPTLRFLTMREYLRDYDWAGEFTEQEVRPWLEEEEAERIAEQG